MAKLIKETPILRGQDAIEFQKKHLANTGKKIDAKTKERMVNNYNKIKAIAKFSLE